MAVVCFLEGFKQPSYMRWTLADTRILEKLFFFFGLAACPKIPCPLHTLSKIETSCPITAKGFSKGGSPIDKYAIPTESGLTFH